MLIKRGSRKAQVTVFVIIAIVLVVGVLFFLFVMPQLSKRMISTEEAQKLLASQVEPVRTLTEDCMKLMARKTLNTIGKQGGYVIPKSDRYLIQTGVLAEPMVINYALFYNPASGDYINLLPSLNQICQSEFKNFIGIDPSFSQCTGDYEQWKKEYDITVGELNVSEVICEDIIKITFTQPVKLSLGSSTTTVDNFVVTIPINMPRIRELASRVLNKIVAGKSFTEAMIEEADAQFIEIKSNPDISERILLNTYTAREPTSDQSGIGYNDYNSLFRIEYSNREIDTPFNFYFLAGIK